MKKYFVKSADGTNLCVEEAGNPAGKPILFIHGFSSSRLAFRWQFNSPLLQGYRLVSFDLRGHGESDQPLAAEFYTEGARWADDVRAIIEAAGLDNPILVGWSLGGRVIGQYLSTYGQAGLAGINFVSSRGFVDPNVNVLGPAMDAYRSTADSDLVRRIESTLKFIRYCYNDNVSEEEYIFNVAINMVVPWQVRSAIFGWSADFYKALSEIDIPCLVTHGRMDRVILPTAAEMMAGIIKTSTVSWYDDCGHSPCVEEPDRFNAELARFVAAAG